MVNGRYECSALEVDEHIVERHLLFFHTVYVIAAARQLARLCSETGIMLVELEVLGIALCLYDAGA